MKRFVYALIAMSLVVFVSCERRELEEEMVGTAKIPVVIDWTLTGLNPSTDKENLYRASVWVFTEDGSAIGSSGKSYKEFRLNSATKDYIELPTGRYSVLIFNNSVSEFSSNVAFRGTDKFDTFEYYAVEHTNSRYAKSSSETVVMTPDILAAWRMTGLEVTAGMVIVSRTLDYPITAQAQAQAVTDLKQLSGVQPELLTYTCNVSARVSELKSMRSASGVLTGMASSVMLATGQTSASQATHEFTMNGNRVYDADNAYDGVAHGVPFQTFGAVASTNAKYGIELLFVLNNLYENSYLYPTPPSSPFLFDVTRQVVQFSSQKTISLDIQIGLSGSDGDNIITLPRIIKEGGFSADIDGWGDDEQIDVPI